MDHLQANPTLFASTALMITMDEAGGLYDSGYIQPLDFFGDGPRIPMIVVSPYSTGGHISHTYSDHVSILKFIERNWHVRPLTRRSRDNFPNPIADFDDPYVPLNSPAIGDLFDLFNFGPDHGRGHKYSVSDKLARKAGRTPKRGQRSARLLLTMSAGANPTS
jgi:phospholipase C